MKKIIAATLACVVLSGCATSLNSAQKQELRTWESKNLAVQEKDPATGAALGILPGFGSFYAREYGYGVLNLLLWPLSVLWDPVSGYEGSQTINYYATKQVVNAKQMKEMKALDEELTLGSISKEMYIKRKREIEDRYSAGV